MTSPSIAIIGAGLSGLVCARVLQVNGIAATVYELDASPTARSQGGSLDIHRDSGQIALREAHLLDEFRQNTHPGGQATRVMDKHAHVFVDEPDSGGGRPEIDRTVLRQLLIDSLAPGTIAWGSKLVSARTTPAGHELAFADGTSVTADVVVGADGAWSRVRPLLTDVTPDYTGITLVEFRLTDASQKHPKALELVGQGGLFALSDDKYIGGHGGEQIALGAGFRVPEDWVTAGGIDWADPAAARAGLLSRFADWDPALTALIHECDDLIVPRPIYALPVGHSWQHVPGVTLVGDAAHLMSPFAGEGANLALIDGSDVAVALARGGDRDKALRSYEKKMFARGAKSAAASADGLTMMFTPDSPREIVRFFRRMSLLSRLAKPFRSSAGSR